MRTIDRAWLAAQRGCGPDVERALAEFGEEVPLTRAALQRAEQLGLNLRWLGCHLADAALRREFVAFTVAQRRPALEALAGPLAADAALWRGLAAEAWRLWETRSERAARQIAVALREAARDGALVEPTAAEAEQAALAALRAVSWAGGDQEAARQEQIEWLASRLIGT